jgi:hypothetical protein
MYFSVFLSFGNNFEAWLLVFLGNDALSRESEFEGCLCFEERVFFHGIVK